MFDSGRDLDYSSTPSTSSGTHFWMNTIPARAFCWIVCILTASATTFAGPTTAPIGLGLGEHDQVVLLVGSGLIHQEQFHGYIETALVRRFPDKKIVCRNLGWSGDTVLASARTKGYQNPAGLERLKKQAAELKPDIIFVGYGSVESFDGPAGLDHFKEGLGKLLDMLAELTPRIVLLSPTFHEYIALPMHELTEHNKNLELYTDAIADIAKQRGLNFVDLFRETRRFTQRELRTDLTDNGILLNDYGYWVVGHTIERTLGLAMPSPQIKIARDGTASATGATVDGVQWTPDSLRFVVKLNLVPAPENQPFVMIERLAPGTWTLRIDDREIVSPPGAQWGGTFLPHTPDTDQEAELRKLVVTRGGLFYRRWNPTNDIPQHYTYIAPDFAMYDAEVADLDKKIAELARPVPHRYELVRKP